MSNMIQICVLTLVGSFVLISRFFPLFRWIVQLLFIYSSDSLLLDLRLTAKGDILSLKALCERRLPKRS